MIFAHLFVVAAIVWWVRQGLEESQIWQDEGKHESAQVASAVGVRGLRGLFSRRVNITALLFLGGIYLFWNTVAGQAGIFMPRVYDTAGLHSAVQQNLLQVLVWGCTVAATYFGFMGLADRMSQRLLYVIGAALGIVGWIVLVAFTDNGVPTMLIFAVLWGVSSGIGAQAFYSLWTSELFATPYRASAQGVMFFVVRTATGLLSYFFPTMLAVTGLTGVGLLLVGLLTVALVIGAVWAPQTRVRPQTDRSRTLRRTRGTGCRRESSCHTMNPILDNLEIELPSWAFGNSGTRFKVWDPGHRAHRAGEDRRRRDGAQDDRPGAEGRPASRGTPSTITPRCRRTPTSTGWSWARSTPTPSRTTTTSSAA